MSLVSLHSVAPSAVQPPCILIEIEEEKQHEDAIIQLYKSKRYLYFTLNFFCYTITVVYKSSQPRSIVAAVVV